MSDQQNVVELAHGAGGLKQDEFLAFITELTSLRTVSGEMNVGIDAFDDGAVISRGVLANSDLIVSTDAHTVDPIFFPGGDIGKLAVCGTVNDVLMMGAKPIALTSSLVIEEGFPFSDLARIIRSMDEECVRSGVPIIAGDTKVVPKGTLDKIIVTTTGVGVRLTSNPVLDSNAQPGDSILVTGPVGSHGVALLSFREGISFETTLVSDVASLTDLIVPLLNQFTIHTMKDPTRGGLASALNEIAEKSHVTITVDQTAIPSEPGVGAAAELLGLDPLEIASEGQAVIVIPEAEAAHLLAKLRKHPQGNQAAIIGSVSASEQPRVYLQTEAGGRRRLQKPVGDLIPRVC